ncbi:integrase core domain protein [Gregarina niphandrodes]|uniref:Integrase core domain protein n=1 Tax=Gregarina niphandrodes TaxID=110365 RepID=A0A023AW70_GRENI|nr:integrase core domain protein [Gregarina niphandrodes]EZG42847.1 integrase core domain protein [Gregarina niphandrodes]|eukprot:XP_011133874.1 integrase core domain protein [Gregarina niphandrodes]
MIRECLICKRLKTPPVHQQGLPTGTLGKAAAMDVVSLDHVGPVYMGGIGWNILVIIDHATRYMMAKTVPTLAAVQTFRTFYRHWVVPFGPPRIVLTDNGPSFKGAFHANTTYQLGCKHLTAAPYRPQGNGINEASHQELQNVLKALWQEGIRDMDLMVDAATRLHNVTPHAAINTSPYEAVFGKAPILDKMQDMTPLTTEQERRQVQQQMLRERMAESLLRQRPLEAETPNDLQPGDIVVVLVDPGSAASSINGPETPKWFAPKWSLPMKVISTTRTQVEVERYGQPGSTFQVHKDKVRRFERSKDPELEAITQQYSENLDEETVTQQLGISGGKRPRITINPETREGLENFLGIHPNSF